MKSAKLSSLMSFTYRRVFSTVKLNWSHMPGSKNNIRKWPMTVLFGSVSTGSVPFKSNIGYFRWQIFIKMKSFLNLRPSSSVLTYWSFISSQDIIFLITLVKKRVYNEPFINGTGPIFIYTLLWTLHELVSQPLYTLLVGDWMYWARWEQCFATSNEAERAYFHDLLKSD